MGQESSKKSDKELFTEYEYSRLSETFHIHRNDLSTVSGDTFRILWSNFMVQSLMETWIQYFIRNEFHYQFRATFDLERFSHLYKHQSSPFIDEKARGIIKIILGTDFSDRILGVNQARVIEYFRDVIVSYMRCMEFIEHTNFMKWKEYGSTRLDHNQKQLVHHFIKGLQSSQGKISELDLESWLRENSFVDDVLGCLLDVCFSFHEFDEDIHPLIPKPESSTQTGFDISHVLFLNAYLTLDLRKSWKLIYSTRSHGFNFTKFSMAVKDIGPTIFFIKETRGYIFGCFASESWKTSPQFFGDSRCFLFQLSPSMHIFDASGYNNNFMYHNFNQQTLANGFGVGGQLGFWGLWLDMDFGRGRCEGYCSTFKHYHRLSKHPDFEYDHLEVWAVDKEEVAAKLSTDNAPTTILDLDPAAKLLLELGKMKN